MVVPPPQPVPPPHAVDLNVISLADWLTAAMVDVRRSMRDVSDGVDQAISRCQAARLKLHEVAALLPYGDGSERIYAEVLVPRPFDPLLLGPVTHLVHAGAVGDARVLIANFNLRPAEDEDELLLQIRGYLAELINGPLAEVGPVFNHCVNTFQSTLEWPLCVSLHQEAESMGKEARRSLHSANKMSHEVGDALAYHNPSRDRLMQHLQRAEIALQEAIGWVEAAVMKLTEMQSTLVSLKEGLRNATGPAPPPP